MTMCVIFGVLFLGATIAFMVWALSRAFPDLRRWVTSAFSDERRQGDPAEEILNRRFARGEITAEEYERVLRVLKR
jgi:uncharacterized membrane protein